MEAVFQILLLLGGLLMIVIGIIGLMALTYTYALVSWGFVLYKTWYWFVLPVFPSLPHVSYVQAIGLSIFITLFHSRFFVFIKDEYKQKKNIEVWVALLSPWMFLLISYLFKIWFVS